jgi:hypothetical protein
MRVNWVQLTRALQNKNHALASTVAGVELLRCFAHVGCATMSNEIYKETYKETYQEATETY